LIQIRILISPEINIEEITGKNFIKIDGISSILIFFRTAEKLSF